MGSILLGHDDDDDDDDDDDNRRNNHTIYIFIFIYIYPYLFIGFTFFRLIPWYRRLLDSDLAPSSDQHRMTTCALGPLGSPWVAVR